MRGVCWKLNHFPSHYRPNCVLHFQKPRFVLYSMRDFSFCIDRGGTFTDVFAEVPAGNGKFKYRQQTLPFFSLVNGGVCRRLKLLSEDPSHYEDAPIEGIRRILEDELQESFPRDQPVKTERIRSIRMGTTVATNALLERKGERMALVVTKGFKDLLHIGNQSRPEIFDLSIKCPGVLYDMVVEVEEQILLGHFIEERKDPCLTGITGETGYTKSSLDLDQIEADLQTVLKKGIKSLAVVFKHAAVFPDHEIQVGQLAKDLGFSQVSLSHEVMPMVKIVPRGFTAAADAYLTPKIQKYISGFKQGFDEGLNHVQVLFMQSDGGLAEVEDFSGHKAILSGPAGGYVGYANLTQWSNQQHQIVGFDMGGTSTDVSRFDGNYEHVYESMTAGISIQAPQLDINTVAAGGGSRLFFQSGMFVVGPESAGAHPGPVCYQKGGPLTITDANLVLGRIIPEFFPKIFGPQEDQPLDLQGAQLAFQKLTHEVNLYAKEHDQPMKTIEEVAMGCVKVANETMSRPIRALTQMKGHDLTQHLLSCFGGAGGQHACALARSLGIPTVFIHKYASILSAVGMGVADVVHEEQTPFDGSLNSSLSKALDHLNQLQAKVYKTLKSKGFQEDFVKIERYLNLRYQGTDIAIMILETECGFQESFVQRYRKEFGFTLDREILIVDLRVRGSGKTNSIISNPESTTSVATPQLPDPSLFQEVYFEETGFQKTPVYEMEKLPAKIQIPGPALLIDEINSILIEPNCQSFLTEGKDVRIEVLPERKNLKYSISEKCDPIQLAIFSHRFMSIAEQMGRTLQRTSVSVNIKERLDYSCALFGPDGGLVANAPHLPVHLGAMSEAVKFQIEYYSPSGPGGEVGLHDGDVLVSNHPKAGGSHLPDITVITPVFSQGQIVFFVASRGHHADIGGLSPGSMPPLSKTLVDEGASIVSFKLIEAQEDGRTVFQEEGIKELLMKPGEGAQKNRGSGARVLSDNLSDLKAQAAANRQGIRLIQELISIYSLRVVQAYMLHIRDNAEARVREMLINFSLAKGLPEIGSVSAQDQMDDGTVICLTVTIDRTNGSAEFDFTGTGHEVLGNCNAPPAVTYSAIIYSLRCMVKKDIPLNQGCLKPITVIIPEGSILSPSDDAAVCGGNVLTSQRVTDVVLRAFSVCAASQGCMNNFTFGNDELVYFETIGGGAGAGTDWHGRSGVQVHMTNTRITDPEILERRYPVVVNRFHLRAGSGGRGRWNGGDGIIREVEFLQPLNVCVLSERRSTRPFGLFGGKAALPGLNLLKTRDGKVLNMGGKAEVDVEPGDRIVIHTPGGGGYGRIAEYAESSAASSSSSEEEEIATGVPYRVGGSVIEYQRLMESA